MIRPAKHLNLNTCVVRAAAVLLAKLQHDRVCSFNDLQSALAEFGPDAEVVFMPTIHLLYLVGRLNYLPKTDVFEYLAPEAGHEA